MFFNFSFDYSIFQFFFMSGIQQECKIWNKRLVYHGVFIFYLHSDLII
jgi:hypothetical protein